MTRTHVYLAPLKDLERTTEDGVEIPLREDALADGDTFLLRTEGTKAYVHATTGRRPETAWITLAEGAWPWDDLTPEDAQKLLHASVFRRKDGQPLPPIPDRGKALENARSRLDTDGQVGDVVRLRLHMDEVLPGDLVESDSIAPHGWM